MVEMKGRVAGVRQDPISAQLKISSALRSLARAEQRTPGTILMILTVGRTLSCVQIPLPPLLPGQAFLGGALRRNEQGAALFWRTTPAPECARSTP